MKFYLVYKNNGLYDPVLDDQEPIYETYEPGDSDQALEPTEVSFKIQEFIDQPEPLQFLEPSPLNAPPPFAESRSLTSSPFVVPLKPYRPFSTEPVVEIPPIEDPIILNPDYQDQFGAKSDELKPDELLGSYYKDAFENVETKTKFKLPVSEKYDPDGKRVKIDLNIEKTFKYIEFLQSQGISTKTLTQDVNKSVKSDSVSKIEVKDNRSENLTKVKDEKVTERVTTHEKYLKESIHSNYKDITEEMVREELKYIEKMKEEIDLEKIENTALTVVDESIERAVSVAEEIKKEIDQELITGDRERKVNIVSECDEFKSEDTRKFIKEKERELDFKTETYEEETIYETKANDNIHEEVIPEQFDEGIKEESSYEREEESKESKSERITQEKHSQPKVEKEFKSYEKKVREEYSHEDGVRERVTVDNLDSNYEGRETKNEYANVTQTHDQSKSDVEQRVYSIGLQTIPNIRGVVTTSHHYDLLLKTFFIHLTDVMVALSRFILTQPVFNTDNKSVYESKTNQSGHVKTEHVEVREKKIQKVVDQKPTVVKEQIESKVKKDMKVKSDRVEIKQQKVDTAKPIVKEMKAKDELIKKESIVDVKKDIKQEMKIEKDFKGEKYENKTTNETEMIEKRKITGSSMAQLSEKKLTQDLTQKMDAVVAEFQTKATTDSVDMLEVKKQIIERNRRSRSRSQVEEEVMRESDPLEWLDKVDSRRASEERTEVRKDFSSTTESFEKKKFESSYEKKQTKRIKPPKQTYIAIVESHVYTNKDAIFEEVSELSETSSVQSAEEINTAFESIQMETTENVAIDNAVRELETAKTLVEENYLNKASSKCEATIETVKEIVHDTKDILDHKVDEKATVKREIQEVVVQESRETIEPIIEIKETKCETVNIDINQSLTTAQSLEININESKKEITNIEEIKKESVSIIKEDYKESATKTELIADEFIEVAKAQEMDVKYEKVKPEYQIVEGEEVTERVVIKSDKDKKYTVVEASAELKIVKELEIETQAEIIEIEDESELITESGVDAQSVINKLEILKSLEVDDTAVTEKSMVTTEIDSNVNREMAVVKNEKEFNKADISKVEISELEQSVIESKELEIKKTKQTSEFESTLNKAINQIELESRFESEKSITASTEIKSELQSTQTETSITKTKSETILEASHETEASFTSKSTNALKIDTERANLTKNDENNNTPTPTVPETPLIDNYVFKLTIPLPKSRGTTPVPRDCTPDEEDPHIVKKKLVPHIDTTIESVVYDPPLPSPPGSKVQSPVYTKPGLRGGSDRHEVTKEEIREIERKSSLLASAIDQTIKSIEEYKEEVGIDTKKKKVEEFHSESVTKSYSSYSKEVTVNNKQVTIKNGKTDIEFEENDTKTKKKMAVIEDNPKSIKSVEITDSDGSTNKIDEISFKSDTKSLVTKNQESGENLESKVESEIQHLESKIDESETDNIESSIEISEIQSNTVTSKENIDVHDVELNSQLRTEIIKANNSVNEESNPEITDKLNTYIKNEVESADLRANIKAEIVEEISKPNKAEKADEGRSESLPGFRPVVFDPESIPKRETSFMELPQVALKPPSQDGRQSPYVTETGEPIGTIQGIVDGLEEPVIDPEVAKELGKPGMPEEKIAELISGESEMMREAHVMGLSRVLNSHIHRIDDSSEDYQKIKPMIDSLKDSEVLKALNEEIARAKEEERKKEEKKWTKFLQKPNRPVPRAKFGYHGWTAPPPEVIEEPYKVKIVRQPKPKVAPDYKPEDFDTGPLPWEERQLIEDSLPPVEPEEPILVPEEGPEFLEAVDPLPESEVPDLEDTGIPLPPIVPPVLAKDPSPIPNQESSDLTAEALEATEESEAQEDSEEPVSEESEQKADVMENKLAEQLVRSVQSMVDPNATLDQQLAQMRAQLAALAQLPEVIQQTLDLVTKQLTQIGTQEAKMEFSSSQMKTESFQQFEVTQNESVCQTQEDLVQKEISSEFKTEVNHMNGEQEDKVTIEEMKEDGQEIERKQEIREEKRNFVQEMSEEEKKSEKQKKEVGSQKSRPPSRANKPQPKFGPLSPDQMAVVLPGGRRWRGAKDVYDEQLMAETLASQAELIQGKVLGFESDVLPYDKRINFKKYEKPPVSLDHLQRSEVYKMVHNMDQVPLKRVELLTPVIAEADYRERCRSVTPSLQSKKHLEIPQQFHP